MSAESGIAAQKQLALPLMLSTAIVVLLVIASVAGIFVSGLYHDTAAIVNTDRGSDLFTLIAVVPALAISIYYSRRGSLRAQIIWLGLIAWVAYYYVIYSYGINFTRVSLVYVAIMSLAVFTLAMVIRRVDIASLRSQFQPSMPRRMVAVYLWLVAAIFSFLWLTDTIPASLSGSTPARLAALHATSNPVEINDLAIIIPTLVIAGILTWRRRPSGYLMSGILIGLATVAMAALLPGGPIFAGQNPDPVYGAVAIVSLIVWVVFMAKVGSETPRRASQESPTSIGTQVAST